MQAPVASASHSPARTPARRVQTLAPLVGDTFKFGGFRQPSAKPKGSITYTIATALGGTLTGTVIGSIIGYFMPELKAIPHLMPDLMKKPVIVMGTLGALTEWFCRGAKRRATLTLKGFIKHLQCDSRAELWRRRFAGRHAGQVDGILLETNIFSSVS